MRYKYPALVSMLLLSNIGVSEEKDNRSPIDAYQGDTQYALLICSTSFKLSQLEISNNTTPSDSANYSKCITDNKAITKTRLNKAIATLKTQTQKSALKNYHVAFMTALEGIQPGIDERVISYQQRQQSLNDKVNEAWARFEVEN